MTRSATSAEAAAASAKAFTPTPFRLPTPSPFCRDISIDTGHGYRVAASVWSSSSVASSRGEKSSSSSSPGGGRLRVLAMHGFLDNAATWDVFLGRIFAVAPDALEVVAIDFAGHGFSDHWPRQCNYALAEQAEAAALVVDQLGWESFALLCHSMGAEIGCLIAAALNDRVSHYIAIEGLGPWRGVKPMSATEDLRLYIDSRNRMFRPKKVHETVDAAAAARMKGMHPLSRDAARTLIRRSLSPADAPSSPTTSPPSSSTSSTSSTTSSSSTAGVIWSSDQRVSLPFQYVYAESAVAEFLAAISCPTLTVWGHTGMWNEFNVRGRAGLLGGGATVVTMPGGHHLHLEPDTAGPAIMETLLWLERQGVAVPYLAGKCAEDVLLPNNVGSPVKRLVLQKEEDRAKELDSMLTARL
ncbi:Alpha/Beta hydrolase protein [Zopfochytrium polystomum]|nr:Alpha/Beta hydrolase protein [Zopfochytrium polystomum]